jgi:diguanylate cyclase (GGDEF)-like protein
MEAFALNHQVDQFEVDLAALRGSARLVPLVTLAWHLRQRDTHRAVALTTEAEALLLTNPPPETERDRVTGRIYCVQGEARLLFGEFTAAQTLADRALAAFAEARDATGLADAHWLCALIASDNGDDARRDHELEQAAACARDANDALRADVAEAALARFSVFRDVHAAQQRWGGRFEQVIDRIHPALAAWVNDFHALLAFQSSEFGQAVRYFIQAHDFAVATGQVVRVITAATNTANTFTNLNDHHTALEWSQRALDIARPTAWPLSIGGCLMQTAETLRHLRRLDAAEELLRESLDTLAALPGSRDHAIATEYLVDVKLDQGDYAAALDIFKRPEYLANTQKHAEFRITALRGQAHALSHLSRPEEALRAALDALALAEAEQKTYGQITSLRVLADIHARHALPAPQSMTEISASAHYLQRALDVGASIEGYTVPGDLLNALAHEYAKAGHYAQAYDMMLRADAAREKTHSQETTNRAIALQVQHQTERERAEAEHHRQLAVQRAEVLQQTSDTLERLGAIGQEITAHLDASAVFDALDRHVHGLLDAHHFSVYLLHSDQLTLVMAFGVEASKPVPATQVALSNPSAYSARCVRERREILVDFDEATDNRNTIPGTAPMLSQLFAPLIIGDRVLGVMTIQSTHRHAYGEREQLIFRTLCAYGAIALDNAAAYRQLEATLNTLSETKAQLEEASITDSLTGLRNRRFLLQHIESDIATTLRRYDDRIRDAHCELDPNIDLVFFMVDLDHFKQVNDTHGHAAGDMVLIQMRQRLEEVFRLADHIVRWGGEEFLVVARNTSRDEATTLAERMRANVAERAFELADGVQLYRTCSIGFACFPFLPGEPRRLSWSQVVELADQCLYMVKHTGRDGWAGLHANNRPQSGDIVQKLLSELHKAIRDGDVSVVTRKACGMPQSDPKILVNSKS